MTADRTALRDTPLDRAAGTAELAQAELRATFRAFATGITVVTSGREVPCGMTANSFTSVSLDPALLLVCVRRDAAIHRAIAACGQFAVSVLSSFQEPTARYFADHERPRGKLEFARVDCSPGPRTGAPLISGALAWFECALAADYDGGDHAIFLGSVLEARLGPPGGPLVFHGGGFHRLGGAGGV